MTDVKAIACTNWTYLFKENIQAKKNSILQIYLVVYLRVLLSPTIDKNEVKQSEQLVFLRVAFRKSITFMN